MSENLPRRSIYLIGCLCLLTSLSSAPLRAQEPTVEIDNRFILTTGFDSNIYQRSDRHESLFVSGRWYGDVDRSTGLLAAKFSTNASYTTYAVDRDADEYSVNGRLALSYPNGLRLAYIVNSSLQAGFRKEVDPFLGRFVEIGQAGGNLELNYALGGRWTALSDVSFTTIKRDIRDNLTIDEVETEVRERNDEQTRSLIAGLRYTWSEKLRLTGYYQFSGIEADGGLEQSNNQHLLAATVDGEIAARLRGNFSIGFQQRDFTSETSAQSSTPYFSTELNWTPRVRTMLVLSASHSFSSTSTNQSSLNTDIGLSLRQEITKRLNCNIGIDWRNRDYKNTYLQYTWTSAALGLSATTDNPDLVPAGWPDAVREESKVDFQQEDTTWSFRFGINYKWYPNLTGQLSLSWTDQASDSTFKNYDQFRFNIGFIWHLK